MTIKVILFKGSTLAARAVRFFTRSQYAHVAIVIDDVLFEARPGYGVRILTNWEQEYKNENYEIRTYEVTSTQSRIMRYFLDAQVGKGYDWIGLVGFVTGTTREARKSRGKWFCSELVAVVFEKVGVKLLRTDPWLLSPRDLGITPALSV